ncbi:MAG: FtsQ-type POTRA domain-containing protein [Clostridiaceae bacterium]|nr:FtsQ-type POTRA domain-containing protein [Clostridiaceae bacterium]
MKRTEISNKNLLHSRKKGKGRLIKSIFILLVLIGSLAAVLMFSPLLLLSDIHADEAVNYTADEIIEASGIEIGENAINYLGGSLNHLIHLRMGKAERNINKLPWVEFSEVKYVFPDKVYITVTERNAIAWICYFGNYLLVDEEGYVLEVAGVLDDRYPEIRGVQLSKFTLGDKIQTEEPEKITLLVQLLKSLNVVDMDSPQKLIEVLDWVDIPKNKELYLSLDNRITAKIKMDDELIYKLSYLRELYYNYIKPEERGMIDFFDNKYARFVAE